MHSFSTFSPKVASNNFIAPRGNVLTSSVGASVSLNGHPCKTLRGLYLEAYFVFIKGKKTLWEGLLSTFQLFWLDPSENLMTA